MCSIYTCLPPPSDEYSNLACCLALRWGTFSMGHYDLASERYPLENFFQCSHGPRHILNVRSPNPLGRLLTGELIWLMPLPEPQTPPSPPLACKCFTVARRRFMLPSWHWREGNVPFPWIDGKAGPTTSFPAIHSEAGYEADILQRTNAVDPVQSISHGQAHQNQDPCATSTKTPNQALI